MTTKLKKNKTTTTTNTSITNVSGPTYSAVGTTNISWNDSSIDWNAHTKRSHQVDVSAGLNVLEAVIQEIARDIKSKQGKKNCSKQIAEKLSEAAYYNIHNHPSTIEASPAINPGDEKEFINNYKDLVLTLLTDMMAAYISISKENDSCLMRKLNLLDEVKKNDSNKKKISTK
ncbi:MAG: hypothetical protein HQ541_10105 [Mariniphaga sp.]|nr:hypothetical protein [Mariniphaga sp.]